MWSGGCRGSKEVLPLDCSYKLSEMTGNVELQGVCSFQRGCSDLQPQKKRTKSSMSTLESKNWFDGDCTSIVRCGAGVMVRGLHGGDFCSVFRGLPPDRPKSEVVDAHLCLRATHQRVRRHFSVLCRCDDGGCRV